MVDNMGTNNYIVKPNINAQSVCVCVHVCVCVIDEIAEEVWSVPAISTQSNR